MCAKKARRSSACVPFKLELGGSGRTVVDVIHEALEFGERLVAVIPLAVDAFF